MKENFSQLLFLLSFGYCWALPTEEEVKGKIRTGRSAYGVYSRSSAFDDIEANEDGTYTIGDMRLGPAQMRMHFGIGSDNSLNSGVMANLRWPGGVIPYEFSNKRGLSLSSRNKQRVRDGIRKFNQEMSGCLEIREKKSSDTYFVSVQDDKTGCWSFIGREPRFEYGGQPLNLLDDGCFNGHGTIAHEFIHAFGFTHEQNRPDREEFVTFHEENLKLPSAIHNFRPSPIAPVTFTKYDGLSIMHYASDAFALSGEKTLVPKRKLGLQAHQLGQGGPGNANRWLTDLDVEKLQKMYNCEDKSTSTNGQRCLTTDDGPKRNSQCVFPFSFRGRLYNGCTDINIGENWCSTRVDENLQHIDGNWGLCRNSCPTDIAGQQCRTKDGPKVNTPCIFPFRFRGKVYNGCTDINIGQNWCSTRLDDNSEHIDGNWGVCDNSCPLHYDYDDYYYYDYEGGK